MSEMYNVIADESELRWFFDNVIQKPGVHESYTAVFCARFKKLTETERLEIGVAKSEAEFMAAQTFRLKKFRDADDLIADDGWNFVNFIKHLYRLNVDKRAYTTSAGFPLPDKCLATIFYVNPSDELKVADEIMSKVSETKTAIARAMLNGKTLDTNLQSYQNFSNIENNVKRARAHCKGSVYWLDYDLDCPEWFSSLTGNYMKRMRVCLDTMYGNGNYLLVKTAGGYHILVRTSAIKEDPHRLCAFAKQLYLEGIAAGNPAFELNNRLLFECIVNDSQIPGIPMPGTFQYGRPVKIINKEEFNSNFINKSAKSYFDSLYNTTKTTHTTN